MSICHERLGLVQDLDSQCSFIVLDHEDPIRHLQQGATQFVLCHVCKVDPLLPELSDLASQGVAAFLLIVSGWPPIMVRSEKLQRRERASCRRRRRQPIHHVRKNKTQLVFLDVCEVGPQLSDFSGLASQGVADLLLIFSCWSATMLIIAKVTQGGDRDPDSLCLGRHAAEGNDVGSTPRAPAPVLSKRKEHNQPRCDHGPALKPRPPAKSKGAQIDRPMETARGPRLLRQRQSCPTSIDQKLPRYDHGLALKSRPPAKSKEAQVDRLTRIEPKQSRNRLSTAIHTRLTDTRATKASAGVASAWQYAT